MTSNDYGFVTPMKICQPSNYGYGPKDDFSSKSERMPKYADSNKENIGEVSEFSFKDDAAVPRTEKAKTPNFAEAMRLRNQRSPLGNISGNN